jgi:catechol 2,3-dioxygenase-like lactoylglutathione lyase family enzyme
MGIVSVRYIVDDVDAAIAFYSEQFGFEVDMHPARIALTGGGPRNGVRSRVVPS